MIAPPPVIYLIENKITGGKYVGQTIRPTEYRWKTHRKAIGEYPLYRAIRKYGVENFTFSVLEISPTYRELDGLERKHIKEQKSFIKLGGYNLTEGGNGLRIQSQKTFEKLSKRFSGENNPNYGKHHSSEVKEKIAKTKRGKILTEEHKSKIRESTVAAFKVLPEESWKKMCAAGDKNIDRRIFTFKNKFTSVVFTGMRHELYTKYNLNKNLLRRMIKGELSHTKGWELVTSSVPIH